MVKEWWISLDDLTNEFLQNWGGWYNKPKNWAKYIDNEGNLLPEKYFLPLDKKYSKLNKDIKFQPYCYLCGFSLFRELKKRKEGKNGKKGKWISYSVKTLDEAVKEIKKGAKLSLEVEHVFPVDEQRALLLGQPNAKTWKNIKDDLKSKKKVEQQNAKSIYQIYNKVYLWSHTTCNQIKSCAGMTSYSNSKLNLPKNIKNLNINIPSYETFLKTITNGSTNINYKGDKVCNQDQGNWNWSDDNIRTINEDNIKLEYKPTVKLGNNPGIRRNISFRNNIIAPLLEKRMKERIKNKKNKPVWKDMNKMFDDDSESSPDDIYDGAKSDLVESINDYTTERAKKIGNRIKDVIKTYKKKTVSNALNTYRQSSNVNNIVKATTKSKTHLSLTIDNLTRDENLDYRDAGYDVDDDSATSDSESVTSEESINEVRQRLNSMESLSPNQLKIEGFYIEIETLKSHIEDAKKKLKMKIPGIDKAKKEDEIKKYKNKIKKIKDKLKKLENTKTKKRKITKKITTKSKKTKTKKGGNKKYRKNRRKRTRRRRRKTKRKTK